MTRSSLRIRLDAGWMRFAQPRDGLELIGTVQDGYQIGALGRTADGSYAQVNGDVVRFLNASRVNHALDRVTGTSRLADDTKALMARISAPPTVVIRKRRRVVIPG